MPYRVTVDKTACLSAGRCVDDEPEAFAFDANELSEALPGSRNLSDEDLLRVARNCPAGAIELVDEDGSPIELF
jgi:ferredoxin